MLTHTKVKAHECGICKKKFSDKSRLVTHFRIHLGENLTVVQNVESGIQIVLIDVSIYEIDIRS